MTERPIIFSAPMVRALLADQKTQTRRIMKPQPSPDWRVFAYGEVHKMVNGSPDPERVIGWGPCNEDGDEAYPLKYRPGDQLWVRENVRGEELKDGTDGVRYLADDAFREIENSRDAADLWIELANYAGKKSAVVPSIHMPRWASRIKLAVTDISVEPLQDISTKDALAEGIVHFGESYGLAGDDWTSAEMTPEAAYRRLWNSINGHSAWEANPWVVAITFTVEKKA